MADGVRVVVGAASGMGLDLARRWAGQGPLLVADRDAVAVDGATASLPCDVTDPAQIDALAAAAAGLGPLRALVVAAGLGPPDGTFEQILSVNLRGTALLLDAFDDQVTDGSVAVGFASVAMFVAPKDPAVYAELDDPLGVDLPGRLRTAGVADDTVAAYCTSKRGIARLVRRKAAEWGPRGGRTVGIAPGLIDTPMGQRELDRGGGSKELRDGSALGRAGRPEEISAVVDFVCSPAASFLTGTTIVVDGGSGMEAMGEAL
jgi:NAD(P)-dependent dehydrogenase (short-subunit alcohol dehydrogenase family)